MFFWEKKIKSRLANVKSFGRCKVVMKVLLSEEEQKNNNELYAKEDKDLQVNNNDRQRVNQAHYSI